MQKTCTKAKITPKTLNIKWLFIFINLNLRECKSNPTINDNKKQINAAIPEKYNIKILSITPHLYNYYYTLQ